MVRRLLTLALAGILTLETSMTAYASNQSGVILEEGFGQEEKTSLNTTNKKACDISDDSSDNNINNDSNDNIGDNHDNNSDNEVSDMPDIDTGNDTESGAETETDAGSNTEIGTDTNTETDAESGASTETETKTDADSDASDNDNPDTSGNEEYISNEDEYDTKEFEELEKTEEIEEIEAEAELLDLLQSYDGIIDINYTAALNEGVEIIAPYATSNNKAWYSMTVPEDGQYVFYSENQVLSGTTYIALYSDRYDKNAHKYQYVSTSEYLSVPTWHLKEGEKVYLAIYNSNGEETYKMKVANQTKLTKTSDGIYSYTLPDGNIIEISIVAGYQYFKFDAAMKENPEGGSVLSGTYNLSYHVDYEDGAKVQEDVYEYLSSSRKYSYSSTVSCVMDSKYNIYFMLTDETEHLIALLVVDPLVIGSTDENLHIHDEVCGEKSIILNIEPIAESNMTCYYAPTDAFEPDRFCNISGWRTIEFTDLTPGTEYTFKFYNTDKTILYDTRQFSTTQGSVFSEVKDYFVEVNDGFTYLNLGATISDFNGVSTYVFLYYEYTDAIGIVRRDSRRIDNISAGSEIKLNDPVPLKDKAVLAGDKFDVKLWLKFPEDNIITKTVTVSAKVPENAYLKEDDIDFKVEETNAAGNGSAKCEVTFSNTATSIGMIYYRPSGSMEAYQKVEVSRNGGNNPYSGTVDGLYSGNEYEFVFCVGGLKLVRRLKLTNTSGLLLERVEEASDYTGPYDIIRTYKINADEGNLQLEENYYLHLNYIQERTNEYESLGYVQLNSGNNYQEIISSAALGEIWLEPDVDCTLKWVLSTSLTPDNSNTEAVLYEAVHTSKANVTLTKGDTYFNSQIYTVALDEDDIANIKANERNITIYGYVRMEGDLDNLSTPIKCELTYGNNYAETLTITNLAPGTSYELLVGTYGCTAEFASVSFSTAEDDRAIKVESVTPAACSARINYSVNGFNEDSTGYFIYFIRKEGYGGWKYQAYISVQYALSKENVTIELYNLETESNYEYKIGYGTRSSQEVTSLQKTMAEGTFTTKADNREIRLVSAQTNINTADIEYSLSGIDVDEVGRLQLYIREKTGSGVWEYNKQNQYTAPSCSGSFTITDLKEDTEYGYRIGFGGTNGTIVSNLRKYIDGEFKTNKDGRTITVKSITTKSLSAKIDCTLSGMENAQDGYLVCYVREVSDAAEDIGANTDWVNKAGEPISSYSTDVSFNITGLKRETSYEYIIGMGASSGTSIDKFEKSIKGEQPFTTTGDLREIKEVVTPGIYKAAIDCSINGLEETAYLLCYICEDPSVGEDNTENEGSNVSEETDTTSNSLEWKKIGYKILKGSEPEHEETFSIQDLREHTVYRYRLGLGSSYNTDVNALEQCVENTFTTNKDIRELSDGKASVEDAGVVLSVRFTGNPEKLPSYVYFFYKADNTDVYNKASRVINASSAESMECSTMLTDLEVSTEYEYAVIISDSDDYMGTPDDIDKSGFKVIGKFTTKDAEIPSEITLSRTQLYLNANASYADKQGYGYQIINPVLTPATASQGFNWESSNPEVAALTGEPGRVNAMAPGKAIITVTSKYNPEVAAECEVVVGNYQLGYEAGDGNITILSDNELYIEKGIQYQGYKLYKIGSNGELSELSADKFIVYSNNDTVASWDDGVIMAKNIGNTKLIFEADDKVPSYLEIYVSSQKGKDFAIVGFTTNYSNYPAKLEEEKDAEGNAQYTLAYTDGITYTAVGESVPSGSGFDHADYNWSIDNEAVATVDGRGIVTPHEPGTVMLSVTPKSSIDNTGIEVLYTEGQQCRVILHIKELPAGDIEKATPVYALADITGKIGDVKFPDDEIWEDWQWKYKDTPLIINGVNKESYPFEAVYMGDKYYAQEAAVNVYIAKMTGVSVYEAEDGSISHNNVVEVAGMAADGKPEEGADSVTLTVESLYNGSLKYDEQTNYFYDVDIADVNGVIIERGEFKTEGSKLIRTFTITAVKKGKYTLTPVIKVKDKNNSNEKILAKTSYKINAVEGAQAYIKLKPQLANGMTIDSTQDGIDRIIIDNDKNINEFTVTAEVTDRNGENEGDFNSLKLAWSTTDKKVASVKAGSDTHTATVTVRGEGHTILTAKAKDKAGHTAVLQIEIRNYAPRVDVSKVNVNLAYDYNSVDGRELALNSGGVVEIVPAYQESYYSVDIYCDDKKTLNHDFSLYKDINSYKYIVCAADSAKTGTYNCYLGVKLPLTDELYLYPLKITVIDKQAKVTVKSNKAVNLFYRSEPASIDVSISGVYTMISRVTWTDNSDAVGNGFASTASVFSGSVDAVIAKRFYFAQENIQLDSKNKLADTGIVSGFVDVKLSGYKQANEGIKTQIKWCYKKPAIVTKAASTTLIPSVSDKSSGYFTLYNKTDGSNILYANDSYDNSVPKYYYNEILSNNTAVKITGTDSGVAYTYSGDKTKGSEKVSFTLKADDWREPLTAVHTIKLAEAVPYLSSPQLVVNTTRVGTMYTDIRLKNAYSGDLECDDIIIEGKDKKAKALLDNDMLEISKDKDINYRINVKQNRVEAMNRSAIANGTYSYKVTPCYTDISGNRIEAKTLTLKIKVTNKEISAKTKTKGSLDLVKGVNSTSNNYIGLTSTFSNIGSGYSIVSSKLVGEYSEYFRLYDYDGGNVHRLTIAQEGKLKAGYKYKLAVEYTIEMGDGDTFVVQSKAFTVKPKQSKAKITVKNNNQILYAAADNITRGYNLSVSDSSYIITDVEGSLDCNKDGKADIQVKYSGNSTGSVIANVSITDADGVLTNNGMQGKTYNIPIVVKLKGRDGISKDIQTKIKVTVRR